MSANETQQRETQHTLLAAWDWFAEQIGLVKAPQEAPWATGRIDTHCISSRKPLCP